MMKKQAVCGNRGQVLVQVALGLVVLLLVVGLAIDGGNVYGERRRMQNAADAGALAGARAICTGGDPVDVAEQYAQRNGADLALTDIVVDMGARTVRVTARKEADTFLMSLAEFHSVTVGADATGLCDWLRSPGGAVPIGFDVVTWDDMDNGDGFLVWADKQGDTPSDFDLQSSCSTGDWNKLEGDLDDYDDEWNDYIYGALGASGLGPGNRGWLRFGDPYSCGASATKNWMLEEEGYPPGKPFTCVPCEPGVETSVLNHGVEPREGDVVHIVIYSETGECTREEAVGDCSGAGGGRKYLPVEGFGRIRIVKTYRTGQGMCGHKAISAIKLPRTDDDSSDELLGAAVLID